MSELSKLGQPNGRGRASKIRNSYEDRLIRAATTQPWTEQLRDALAMAVAEHGGRVHRFDNCGDLVDLLEALLAQ